MRAPTRFRRCRGVRAKSKLTDWSSIPARPPWHSHDLGQVTEPPEAFFCVRKVGTPAAASVTGSERTPQRHVARREDTSTRQPPTLPQAEAKLPGQVTSTPEASVSPAIIKIWPRRPRSRSQPSLPPQPETRPCRLRAETRSRPSLPSAPATSDPSS